MQRKTGLQTIKVIPRPPKREDMVLLSQKKTEFQAIKVIPRPPKRDVMVLFIQKTTGLSNRKAKNERDSIMFKKQRRRDSF